MKKLFIIGIGPGGEEDFTLGMIRALEASEVIVGYKPYLNYIKNYTKGKEIHTTGMKSEIERCKMALTSAEAGKTTAMVSTGDAGLYGMAGPLLELAADKDIAIEVIPGISANFAAASCVGAPIMHDMATISLSDLMTPLDLIKKRIRLAAQGDFVICFYNPRSKGRPDYLKKAMGILKEEGYEDTRPVALVKHARRDGEEKILTTIGALDDNFCDMNTMVIVGNKETYVKNGFIITPRGYKL
ncbi:precorrin-3B C(17)-methyltransferase [Peptoniphilus sp. EMRHCC_23]|uniref:precorrin-3B C(17)-methyltransferase n=1 Tax=Peptoniphilus rachelemmaiella TaxID=2811779 RepID=UPI001C006EFD|nr:precorrin-3B C(17)-methyltransferase [Peptoniphilus rachelemmaiella]